MAESEDVGDLFVVRSAIVPMIIAVLAGTILSFFGFGAFLSFFPVALPFLGVWVGYMLLMLLRADSRRKWREVLSRIIVLVCVWPCLFYLCLFSGDYIHLAIMYPSYLFKIGINQQVETRFDWDDARFVGTDYQRVLVFDPSDRIIQEDVTRPSDSIAPTLIRHLLGHFYLVLETPSH